MIRVLFYNAQENQLRLQFDGGEVYDYFLVPPDVGRAAEVALAGENPAFFGSAIKGIYPYRRLT